MSNLKNSVLSGAGRATLAGTFVVGLNDTEPSAVAPDAGISGLSDLVFAFQTMATLASGATALGSVVDLRSDFQTEPQPISVEA